MFNTYDDITSRIDSEPLWFDEYSVPRYCKFEPTRSASIHVPEIALAEIKCQNCGHGFRVACSALNVEGIESIAQAIRDNVLVYGDPPNIWCCEIGPCQTAVTHRVIEYWYKADPKVVEGLDSKQTIQLPYQVWVRDPSYEGILT